MMAWWWLRRVILVIVVIEWAYPLKQISLFTREAFSDESDIKIDYTLMKTICPKCLMRLGWMDAPLVATVKRNIVNQDWSTFYTGELGS